jgi:hypothetical protein
MSIQTIDANIEASAAHYGDDEETVREYMREGLKRAYDLPNRGPIRFEEDGALAPDILDAHSHYGFYVFENVLAEEELADIKADIDGILDRLPTGPESPVDKHGRPALGADREARTLIWAKPLSDPLGGTEFANGRHQVKLFEPEAADGAPTDIVFLIVGSLQYSEAALRVYGHPQLLEIAAQINGEDFVPFNEALFIKEPGLGAAVSWHQDGTTHWDNPDLDEGTHGFNYMAQLYGSDPVNGVWVVPGTHKLGKVDIRKMVEDAGTERLPGAIPLVCDPGDVFICSRQLVHGSFPNTGLTPRVTVNFGFHRRSSVIGLTGAGFHRESQVYDDARIHERSKAIAYGIDARHQRFPEETPYIYRPFAESGETFRWDENAKAKIKDYDLLDLSI